MSSEKASRSTGPMTEAYLAQHASGRAAATRAAQQVSKCAHMPVIALNHRIVFQGKQNGPLIFITSCASFFTFCVLVFLPSFALPCIHPAERARACMGRLSGHLSVRTGSIPSTTATTAWCCCTSSRRVASSSRARCTRTGTS